MTFETRHAAGQELAAHLTEYAGTDTVILGLTRGGMVVAHEVARALDLPLDALVVHKIPGRVDPPLHIGVVAEPDHVVMNVQTPEARALPREWLDSAVTEAVRAVDRRRRSCRGGRALRDLTGRRVIVVDDSAATGTTLRAAVAAVKDLKPREIVVAVPVAPPYVVALLRARVDRVVCLATPADLIAGAIYYPTRGEATDDDIRRLLESDSAQKVGAGAR